MDFTAIVNQMVVLCSILVVGFAANKLGFMNAEFNRAFSGFVINVSTPALILHSCLDGQRLLDGGDIALLLVISLLSYALVIGISFLMPTLLGSRHRDRNMIRFMTIFSNSAFMGFPVVEALLGAGAVFYAAIFNLPFNLLVYSYGVRLASEGREKGFDKKVLLSPCILASVLALVLYLTAAPVPTLAVTVLGYLANITVPGAMLIIGSTLALIPLKSVFTDPRIYGLSLAKLIIIPVIIWFLVGLLPLPEFVREIAVILWALPVATNSTMMATLYGGDENLASKGVLISTLLSVVTIPILMRVLYG